MILKDYPCNLCGSSELKTLYPPMIIPDNGSDIFACTSRWHGIYYQVVRCASCGLIFSSPRPAAEDIEAEYSQVEDLMYAQEIAGRLKTFDRNVKNLSRFSLPGRLLDIGSGMGAFVHIARQNHWEAQGIEPSLWCTKKAKELFGLDIPQGTYKEAKNLGKNFDVVTMWDVIEHVDDPAAALRACHSILKPDGILVLSTVDIGSCYARLMGKRWPWLMKMHIYYFNRRVMHSYLEMCGFRILSMSVYRHTISMRYLIYKLEGMSGGWYMLGRLLSGMHFLSDSYLTVALGDFMEVYAQKKPRKEKAEDKNENL